jgi:DNA-directed RNA polymerase specialized sigma24 family protein
MEPSSGTSKKDWMVTRSAFDRLLRELDPDRERAGEKYERIRLKLIKLFRWRGCPLPEEYVDRTIDRVARRLEEGAELRVTDPYLYFHGVALNVLREYWREPGMQPLEAHPHELPHATEDSFLDAASQEERLECLSRCLGRLPRGDFDLISMYHLGPGANKERRARIAKSMRVPLNTLRIRVFRLRVELEACIERCLEK